MKPRYPDPTTQAGRVLKALMDANGEWVSKRKLQIEMMLPQAGRALNTLENDYGWSGRIEHGNPDNHRWMSYRIKQEEPAQLTLMN